MEKLQFNLNVLNQRTVVNAWNSCYDNARRNEGPQPLVTKANINFMS